MASPDKTIIAVEAALWIGGIVLLWRLRVTRNSLPARPALPRWRVTPEAFILCVLLVFAGASVAPRLVARLGNHLLGPAAYDHDWWTAVQGAAFQLGLLGGVIAGALILRLTRRGGFAYGPPSQPVEPASLPSSPTRRPLLAGVAVFVISVPLIHGTGLLWKWLLERVGVSTNEQELLELFRNADDPALLLVLVFMAAVLAPITEELVFRKGLFRFLHTRVARSFALTLPALIFSLLHWNAAAGVPLFALAVLFAIAYERTGRIAVPIIAHALFNLHTVALALYGAA